MRFADLVDIVGDEPVFETGLLLAGDMDEADARRQLYRWTRAGRIIRLRRDLYTLAPPFQRAKPHPFVIANRMARGSYVSRHSALAHYGTIPEYVPVVTSVTTSRPVVRKTPLGTYDFRHLKAEMFYGYRLLDLGGGQQAYVATPEKALLDLVYLQPGGDLLRYLRELRLQSLDLLDLDVLGSLAAQANSPKLRRAAARVAHLARSESSEFERL